MTDEQLLAIIRSLCPIKDPMDLARAVATAAAAKERRAIVNVLRREKLNSDCAAHANGIGDAIAVIRSRGWEVTP